MFYVNLSVCRQKSKSMDDKKTDRALRDIQPVEVDGSVRFTSVRQQNKIINIDVHFLNPILNVIC